MGVLIADWKTFFVVVVFVFFGGGGHRRPAVRPTECDLKSSLALPRSDTGIS